MKGIQTISITDHDTVDGIEAAILSGKKNKIDVIPGVELSAEYNGSEIHILGYFIDYKDVYFCNQLKSFRDHRINRIFEIVDKLQDLNVQIDAKNIFDIVGNGSPGRLHVAEELYQSGYTKNIYDSFYTYLGNNKPAYVKKQTLDCKKTIELIVGAGGVPVLAHPYKMNNDAIISDLVDIGLQGIEVYYPSNEPVRAKYKMLADKYGMVVTGGSDYHGRRRPDVCVGTMTIGMELVEKLKERSMAVKRCG